MYVILPNIKINILQDAGIQKLFFPVSSTPLWVLDAEMDMGTAPIIRSASRTYSGPLEVLPGLEHSGTSKKKQNWYFGHHSSCTKFTKFSNLTLSALASIYYYFII